MINYVELTKRLKEKDEHIITKLYIYNSLLSLVNIGELTPNEIIDFLNEIYLDIDTTACVYSEVEEAILVFCNYDLQKLLSCIRADSDRFKEQILEDAGLF
ncbi:hypothetical protein [Thomasclavelia cocleata]|jgi:hypothetical protein|uniref:hypothetical protein n=1 Tax=Thomasclavelia cocleata TaxID=69824 RepID=UPI00272E73BC|nr:hypothetical protein [Thomasclavelia cocleata]